MDPSDDVLQEVVVDSKVDVSDAVAVTLIVNVVSQPAASFT